jgi:hypothetical protein
MPLATSRAAARLVAAGLALTALGGCSFSSNNVSCDLDSCTATLTGDGAEAEILGQKLSFGGTEDGRAALTVAGIEVSCTEGESVAAGPLRLECTSVDENSVELTASRG